MRWILAGGLVGLAATLIGLAVALSNSSPLERARFSYATSTPQETLDAVWLMIDRGETQRLPELVHAESDEMRSVFLRVGRLLANLETLALEIQKEYPEEVEALRIRAQADAAAGRGAALRFGRGGAADSQALQSVFADPYGWLERSRGRVTTLQTADNIAAVMVDGKPAFGVGVVMRLEADGWRFVPPTNLPFISRYMPRTREEHMIVASMVQVIDNAIVELASDVRRGVCRSLNAVAERAGEKAWIPMVMCVVAYTKAMEARESADEASPGGATRERRGSRSEIRIGL